MKNILSVLATLVFGATMLLGVGGASAAPTAALPVNHAASSIAYTTFAPSCAFHGKIDVGHDKWGKLIVTGSATFSGCWQWNRWQAHFLPVMQSYIEDVDNPMVSSPADYAGGAADRANPGSNVMNPPVSTSNTMLARSMHRYRLVASIRPYTMVHGNEIDSFTVTVLVIWPVLSA